MNIIRSTAVELSLIPAITYKQKLASGGAGIRIFRLDQEAVAVFTVDRRTGEGVPYGPYDADLFPDEAVQEALELTVGLPFSARGKLNTSVLVAAQAGSQPGTPSTSEEAALESEDVMENETEKIDMVGSDEYQAFLDRYTDEKGKINYTLMNKDFIQFASRNKTVEKMVAEKADVDEMLRFVINNRAAYLAGKKDSLTDAQTDALIETLDEIDPRSAFKDLKLYMRRLLAKAK
ncbi:MAG: hypothetical protein FWG40_09405 [Peptococcaceae bacterium]|nr:hypothetical protein [Peptococcaceae bacterium]